MYSRNKLFFAGLVLFTVAFAVGIFGGESSRSKIPEGYEKLDSYYYIDETGEIREIEGPFYFDSAGGTYYTQSLGNAFWIPFAAPDYEPVTLPESNTTQNDSTITSQCPSCGAAWSSAYCGDCGSLMPTQ